VTAGDTGCSDKPPDAGREWQTRGGEGAAVFADFWGADGQTTDEQRGFVVQSVAVTWRAHAPLEGGADGAEEEGTRFRPRAERKQEAQQVGEEIVSSWGASS
jgi:hypothetical protein